MEILSFLSISAGVLGIVASAISTWLIASRKPNVKIKVGDREITISSAGKEITAAEIQTVVSILRDQERDTSSASGPAADSNGKP